MNRFRSTTATNTGTTVSAVPCELFGLNISNRHNAAIYVRFYNIGVPSFQDTPILTVQIAASGTLFINEKNIPIESFGIALGIRVTTDTTDSGNTAAATLPIIELKYK